jgi:hypothetical protein
MSLISRRRRIRRAAATATLAATGALISAGVMAAPAAAAVGYPTPGGIYAPFTDCPLNDPAMDDSLPGFATGCIASISDSGTFTIHGIPVAITHPVTVQFGVHSPASATGGNQFEGGVVQPLDGKSLDTSPEQTPGGLPALLCPGDNPTLARICQAATSTGQTGMTALVQSAGPIDDFHLTGFTQPVKIQLINPLLGGNCYIGSDSDPIVLHPEIVSGDLGFAFDPDPVRFPNVAVLSITNAVARDDTFVVPQANGCGPGGVADAAINTRLGLPAPSGTNHLVLNGNSYFADDFSEANQADELREAFLVSAQP